MILRRQGYEGQGMSRTCQRDTWFDYWLEKAIQFLRNLFGAESHGPNTTTPLASAKTTEPSN